MNLSCQTLNEIPSNIPIDTTTAKEVVVEIKKTKPLEGKIIQRTINNLENAISYQNDYLIGLEKKLKESQEENQELQEDADFGRRVKMFAWGIVITVILYGAYRLFKIAYGLHPIG